MQLQPILVSLRYHKLTAIMLILQVAFTCAIVCNVIFMVVGRVERISLPSGIAENELSVISSITLNKDGNPQAQHAADLAALRVIPGVQSVVATNGSLPLNGNDHETGTCASLQALKLANQTRFSHHPGCVEPSLYWGTPGEVNTLGLRLIKGRDFLPDEYTTSDTPQAAIITRSLAQRLYPGENALGRNLYTGSEKPIRIVGIIATLLRGHLINPGINQYSMLVSRLPNEHDVLYVMRSAPQDRQRVLKAAAAALMLVDPERIIDSWRMQTYTQIRHNYFRRDTTMIGMLIASAIGLMFVTALGISGLANFWVQQRTRTIGIRRALGATRGDIQRYFQAENFLLTTVGIVLGMLLAYGINLFLMTHYELPRLPLYYLPISALALWSLGQLAVLGPALHAAAVQPMTATRSV